MAGEMLLINPRKRRRASAGGKKRRVTRRRRNPIVVARKVAAPRRSMTISRHRRRRNPVTVLSRRRARRRNPIGRGIGGGMGLNAKNLVAMFKDAAIGGAGGVVFDLIMGQINPYLPASFQTQAGVLGTGDAVKAVITAVIGQAGAKYTKGWSKRLAQGALTVQAYEIMAGMVPSTMAVGYASPARIIPGSPRVGPTRGGMMGAYMRPGKTAVLNAYMQPGKTALLNSAGGSFDRNAGGFLGGTAAQMREGVSLFK